MLLLDMISKLLAAILCHIQFIQFFSFLFSDGISIIRKKMGDLQYPEISEYEKLNSLKKKQKLIKTNKS